MNTVLSGKSFRHIELVFHMLACYRGINPENRFIRKPFNGGRAANEGPDESDTSGEPIHTLPPFPQAGTAGVLRPQQKVRFLIVRSEHRSEMSEGGSQMIDPYIDDLRVFPRPLQCDLTLKAVPG